MLPLKQPNPDREELFISRYGSLHDQAMRLTDRKRNEAEDLLHDAFLHFTLSQTPVESIQNLDAYLYTMLRNLRLSQVRRLARGPHGQTSLIDFDSAETGLNATDPRDKIKSQDELRSICQYAFVRRETSKAGGVLILRFFHGYLPNEIARILRSPRSAVDNLLQTARREAKVFRTDPEAVTFLHTRSSLREPNFSFGQISNDILSETREALLRAPHADCPKAEIADTYRGDAGEKEKPVSTRFLSHIVTCRKCLDAVNEALGLPGLNTRMGGDDSEGNAGGGQRTGGGSGGGMGPTTIDTFLKRSRAKIKQVMEHLPEELLISVNGFIIGSQRINSEISELALSVNLDEKIGFIEVFSERDVCLLFHSVEPPPDGPAFQPASVELSNGRTLDLALDFAGAWPQLNARYHDPSFVEGKALATEHTEGPEARTTESVRSDENSPTALSPGDRVRSFFQPVRLTVGFAALLIATLLVLKFGPWGTPAASDLIARSIEADNARLADGSRVLHRTLDLEETAADGSVLSRKKIDIWQSGEKGITARRLYDEKGQLAAGDWRRANGVQTIYSRGTQPKLQPLPEKRTTAPTFDDAWQVSASAQDFKGLVASLDKAQVETLPNAYRINYEQPTTGVSTEDNDTRASIIRAAITLNREDLHATEQDFTLCLNGETRSYRIVETGYDWKLSNTVAPAVFEPNVELTGLKASPNSRGATPVEPDSTEQEVPADANSNTSVPPASVATAALEVQVIDLLNGAGAFMGEQVSVNRTGDGRITVNALVDTDKRKAELLNALSPVRGNPAVRIAIETVAEAQAREAKNRRNGQQQNISIDTATATENTSPVYLDLRKKFDDAGTRAFANRVLARSSQARRHALAAKQLSDRFSLTDLQSLTPDERAKWINLIVGHAREFAAQYDALQRDLATVFPDLAGGGSGPSVASDRDIQAAVRSLYDLSVMTDEDLRGSFALLTTGGGSAEVKTAKFWRSLNNAIATARALQNAR